MFLRSGALVGLRWPAPVESDATVKHIARSGFDAPLHQHRTNDETVECIGHFTLPLNRNHFGRLVYAVPEGIVTGLERHCRATYPQDVDTKRPRPKVAQLARSEPRWPVRTRPLTFSVPASGSELTARETRRAGLAVATNVGPARATFLLSRLCRFHQIGRSARRDDY